MTSKKLNESSGIKDFKRIEGPELFIGLIGPIGVDMASVIHQPKNSRYLS